MLEPPIKFAYVGCGFVAQTIHIPNFKSLPDCEFKALAEYRQDLGESVARRFDIPKVYRSHKEIAADPDIDAVGVSAAYAVQGRIAEDLIEAGKHVFMEKPMAVSVARAQRLVDAVNNGGGRLMVGYMKRYDPGNRLLKQHLNAWKQSGEAGRILLGRNHGFGGNWTYANDPNVVFEQSSEPQPPAANDFPEWLPEKYGKQYLDYLQQWTHNINLLRFFLDDSDRLARITSVQLDSDGMTGLITFDIKGTRCIVESAYTRFHGWEEHTQIYFEGGWLRTEAPPLMAKQTPASVEIYQAGDKDRLARLTKEYAPPAWSYREEAKHFLDAVRSGEPFGSSAEDTLHDVRLCEDIYKIFIRSQGESI